MKDNCEKMINNLVDNMYPALMGLVLSAVCDKMSANGNEMRRSIDKRFEEAAEEPDMGKEIRKTAERASGYTAWEREAFADGIMLMLRAGFGALTRMQR